jgi:apolipoprotein N-acyltransferase
MNKIRYYFSTLEITRGFFIALLASAFIYLNHWGLSHPLMNTILALSSLFLLLQTDIKTWFWYGVFIGLFWFWWIALSLEHYGYAWGLPIGIVLITFVQGLVFWGIAKVASFSVGCCKGTTPYTISLFIKAFGLFILSYIHPFGFDWLKPELMFIESYIGIEKWQFALVLLAITLGISKKNIVFLLFILMAYSPSTKISKPTASNIQLITTHTSVQDKWDESKHMAQFKTIFQHIDKAIKENKKLIILPESVFPIFLNRNHSLIAMLQERAKYISIVTGGLYWDNKTPHNSAYIFTNNTMTIANKVLLVPFGESNPLPDFLSDWINEVFYDGSVDYVASTKIVDYSIDGITYRNAICFEATSEKLYEKDAEGKHPKNMIVLSNNGWFTPSIEPTLQKLLLQYYSKKYGTTIYHSVNMSESYVIHFNSKSRE